jgi:hypothetical protein
MEQEKWRLEKDYDDVSRELTVDPIRFNYGILKNKGVFLSMKDQKIEQTVEDSPKSE